MKDMDSSHNVSECGSCHSGGGHAHGKRPDFLLWGTGLLVAAGYLTYCFKGIFSIPESALLTYGTSVFDLINTMWWGIAVGIVFIGLLSRMPRDLVMGALGTGNGLKGIVRATLAGIALDLCSHGILMVGAKLYERGVTAGQMMAFLIASPWNSFSLTLILWSLIGFKWMITFLLLSMLIGIVSGLIFEALVKAGKLPANPNRKDLPQDFRFWAEAKKEIRNISFSLSGALAILWDGLKESRMILRWLLLGVVIAALARTFMSEDMFQDFFGPSLAGLGLTILTATVIEVCSEGTTPIAADIVTRAGAPGNGFAFLMTGVSTDYTEILVLREATKSWKLALFLPLVTLPQVFVLAWLLNGIPL